MTDVKTQADLTTAVEALTAMAQKQSGFSFKREITIPVLFIVASTLAVGITWVGSVDADVTKLKVSVSKMESVNITEKRLEGFKYEQTLKQEIVNEKLSNIVDAVNDNKSEIAKQTNDINALNATVAKSELAALIRHNELKSLLVKLQSGSHMMRNE